MRGGNGRNAERDTSNGPRLAYEDPGAGEIISGKWARADELDRL